MDFEQFFKLTDRPFKANLEAKFFYRRPAFDELCRILGGQDGDLPMVLFLRGPEGVGKTTFLRRLPQALRQTTRVAPILGATLQLGEILEGTLNFLGLGSKCPPTAREESLLGIFQNAVSGLVESGLALVLAVDDAPGVPEDVLGDLLALTRLEPGWNGRAALMLAGPDSPGWPGPLPPDSVLVELPPMDAPETRLYLRHRLSAAGCDRELFAPAALDALKSYGRGLPALLNPLAERALMTAWANGRRQAAGGDVHLAKASIDRGDTVDVSAAKAAGSRTRGRARAPGRAWKPLAAAGALVAAAAITLALASGSGPPQPPAGPEAPMAAPPAPEVPVATATPAAAPGLPQEGAMALPSPPPGLANLPRGAMALVVDPDRGLGRLWQGGSGGAGLKAEISAPEFPDPGLFLVGRQRGRPALVFQYPPAKPSERAPSKDAGDRLWSRAEALLPQDHLPLMVGEAAELARAAHGDLAAEIARRVSSWTKSQEYKLSEDMAGLYAESFQYYEPGRQPLTIDRRAFRAALDSESRAAGEVALAVSEPLVMVDPRAHNRAWAVFNLKYDSKIRHDTGLRTLIFEKSPFGGQWLIVAELWLKEDALGQ
jgi:type II secretory pathway predicted ATPase ExeA